MRAPFTRFDKALKAATEKSIAAAQTEIERQLAARIETLEVEVRRAADLILDVGDRLGDDGDRAYLGSTNDVETIRKLGHRLNDLID